ncbi:SixA phosphatase family protein [Flaviflexus huanghaiensis]|uniref:SixA phosphatase family protein n=1 Tax=Flaviflexus huanghaiensis TaxID=1111473 RepID=UPI0015FE3A25|nr:histidine phosphatase family protein [Flaviflexus huanghaiensis]
MRHAKSSWSTGHLDHERPLNGRGRRQGLAAGRWLSEHYPRIDRVLCSTSTRTRETLERVQAVGVNIGTVTFHRELYESAPEDALHLLCGLSDEQAVLLLGHYSAVPMLVGLLDPRSGELDFVTSGIAALDMTVPWANVGRASGTLIRFVAPGRD